MRQLRLMRPTSLSRDPQAHSAARRAATGLAGGAVAIAAVSLLIAALDQVIEPTALTSLYLFAILPVAIAWGFRLAGIVALGSFVTFSYFFLPPHHSFAIAHGEAAAALVITLVTAYLVSELARRAYDRAEEARAKTREAEEAQAAQRRLTDEHAALGRVATLVAQGLPTAAIFESVTREVGLLCNADVARMERFEPDTAVTGIAAWARDGSAQLAVNTRFALDGASIAAQVRETGQPARVDSFAGATGAIAREAQSLGIHASVGCPIRVGGQLWGVVAASRTHSVPFPADTESRIGDFTDLVATAISNSEARADLVASRQRLLTAGDEARRRVVRDLHDGAQQRFVHAILTLELALREFDTDEQSAKTLVVEALEHAKKANREIRELAHGLVPAALSRGGLAAGVESIVLGLRVPVDVSVPEDRFPAEIESSAYFVVAEALTNVVKHSGAQHATVAVRVENGGLRIDVCDDGVGGARSDGSGLIGLRDRVVTLGGDVELDSPEGRGTRIAVTLPVQH